MAYLLGYLAEKERFAVESIADGRKAVASALDGLKAAGYDVAS